MTSKMSYQIIAVLISFNIFMLYQNIQRVNSINDLNHQLAVCEQSTGNPTLNTASVRLSDELISPDNTLSLVTMFTDRGCEPCIIDEINFINKLYEKYNPYMNVYLVDGYERYLVNLGAQFRYEVIDQKPELEDIHLSNPVSLLIDRNRTVHHIHFAEIGNVERSRLFFQKVSSLFEAVYGG